MNIKNYFTQTYQFQINPIALDRSDKLFFLVGALSIVLAVLLKIAAIMSPSPVDRKYRNKFYHIFLTAGVAELLWYGARVETINFFGSHFVALLILAICFVWFVVVLADTVRHYGTEKKAWEKEQVKLRYLPAQ